jgi:hypothetical protein
MEETVKSLQEKVLVLEQKFEALEAVVAQMATNTTKGSLAFQSEQAAAPTLSGQTFTVNKVSYRALYPAFHLDGKDYTEADLLASKPLQTKLVEMGSGLIEAVA